VRKVKTRQNVLCAQCAVCNAQKIHRVEAVLICVKECFVKF